MLEYLTWASLGLNILIGGALVKFYFGLSDIKYNLFSKISEKSDPSFDTFVTQFEGLDTRIDNLRETLERSETRFYDLETKIDRNNEELRASLHENAHALFDATNRIAEMVKHYFDELAVEETLATT
ncbi:hypothetical protein N9X66_10010 [Gammaproteobacteria bacterium]|nr:hypothetical protein [Gammaproteobacteria bacterium]